jgi:Fur family peroxide stress response transcriptional regulator
MAIKLTTKRQAVLDTLKNNHGTMSAADIHSTLPNIDLVTIYRTVELFTKEKMIKQFHLTSGEAQYEYQTEPHHHAVCTTCERVIHFTAPDQKLKKLLGIEDFDVDEIEVTVKGICHKH